MAGVVKVGPWGGSTGSPVDVGSASRIQGIRIRHGDRVDCVAVNYVDVDGKDHDIVIGGTGGTEAKIDLEVGEYFNGIGGYVCVYEGHTVVAQLTLRTNWGHVYGPYGEGRGNNSTFFSLPIPGGKITNFFGSGEDYVDSIGAYLAPN